MADLLFVGTHATDDPTSAALPFVGAIGAVGAKVDVAIALMAEAPYLMKDEIAKTVMPVGFKPLSELIHQVIGAKIPIYV